MDGIFGKDWTGSAYVLFGPEHLLALSLVVLVNILLVVIGRRSGEKGRKAIRITLAVILLADEALWHIYNAINGMWTLQLMLPLHLCSVFVFLCAYMLITGNYSIYEFAYFLGIAGATQALLTPDAGRYGYPHFRAFQVIISHGAIVTSALFMTLVEGYRPTWGSLKRVLIGGNLYMAVIFVLNLVIGSNYLFIAHKPETASLMDVLPPWPVYILFLEILGIVMSLVLYLPFYLGDLKRSKVKQ